MLVEDSASEVMLFRRTLESLGTVVDLTVFASAEAAYLHLMASLDHTTHRRPDLLVTDINLPGKTGLDLVRDIKATPVLRSLPCVVFSSSSAESDIRAAYDALASGYLTKPITPGDYLNTLRILTNYWFGLVQTPVAASEPMPAVRI